MSVPMHVPCFRTSREENYVATDHSLWYDPHPLSSGGSNGLANLAINLLIYLTVQQRNSLGRNHILPHALAPTSQRRRRCGTAGSRAQTSSRALCDEGWLLLSELMLRPRNQPPMLIRTA